MYLHRLLDKLDALLKAPIDLKDLNDTSVLMVFWHMNALKISSKKFCLTRALLK